MIGLSSNSGRPKVSRSRVVEKDGDSLDRQLKDNSLKYERLIQFLRRIDWRRNPDLALQFIRMAAHFASHRHTGRFSDGSLENIVLAMGYDLERLSKQDRRAVPSAELPRLSTKTKRQVLHVISWALPAGGPTRTIKNWINLDKGSCSSLVLLEQDRFAVPDWLGETVTRSGGDLFQLPRNLSAIERARYLRAISHSSDIVILHTYTFDTVPGLAFAIPGGPPVALVNHSDHIFWLNSSITDLVVHQREVSKEIGTDRRLVRNETVLPIPLLEHEYRLSRAEARAKLGIPDSQIVLLSVGSVWKLFPTKVHDFPNTALKILAMNPKIHLYILAWDWGERPDFLFKCSHERFHLLPCQLDASLYQLAADIYIEGFPFGSQTAMLEAALCGLPIVRAYSPGHRLLVTDDEAISAVFDTPRSEEEYIRRVQRFVDDPIERSRMGNQVSTRVRNAHTGECWKSQVENLYNLMSGLSHLPTPIPETKCASTDVDRAVFGWQMAQVNYQRPQSRVKKQPISLLGEQLWCDAYNFRNKGHYRRAYHVLRCLCAVDGWRLDHLTAIAKLLPHKLLYGHGKHISLSQTVNR